MAKKADFKEVDTGRNSVLNQIDKAAADLPEKEQKRTVRTSIVFEEDIFDYIKTIGAARFGTMAGYLEELVRRDREAWKENEEKLRELLSK